MPSYFALSVGYVRSTSGTTPAHHQRNFRYAGAASVLALFIVGPPSDMQIHLYSGIYGGRSRLVHTDLSAACPSGQCLSDTLELRAASHRNQDVSGFDTRIALRIEKHAAVCFLQCEDDQAISLADSRFLQRP